MIAVEDIAYVRYQVTDLDRQERFLEDFGLLRVERSADRLYMRAKGSAHHVYIAERGPENATLGFGLQACSEEDLHILAQQQNRPVEAIQEPGGGRRVRLVDPNGFVVDVIHGQARHEPLPTREPFGMNPATGRQRYGTTVRTTPAPCSVMRVGHVALCVRDFAKTHDFYSQVLGFKASDTYWAGQEGNVIAAFMHCGLGDRWTDHHTLALITAQDGQARFDHSAFEVLDLDDLVQGGEYLRTKGWQHSWGVGRHIQGSQIFDYWRDPSGHKIEHWTDGDLVNDSTPAGTAPISAEELRQWAPPVTPEFFA